MTWESGGAVWNVDCHITGLILETEFLTMANASLGETWSARIRGKPLSQRPVLSSLIVYIYNEGRGEMAYHLSGQRSLEEVYGHTPEVHTMYIVGDSVCVCV